MGLGAAALTLYASEEDGRTCGLGKEIRCQHHDPAGSCLSSAAGPRTPCPAGTSHSSSCCRGASDTPHPLPRDFCSFLPAQLCTSESCRGTGISCPRGLWSKASPPSLPIWAPGPAAPGVYKANLFHPFLSGSSRHHRMLPKPCPQRPLQPWRNLLCPAQPGATSAPCWPCPELHHGKGLRPRRVPGLLLWLVSMLWLLLFALLDTPIKNCYPHSHIFAWEPLNLKVTIIQRDGITSCYLDTLI